MGLKSFNRSEINTDRVCNLVFIDDLTQKYFKKGTILMVRKRSEKKNILYSKDYRNREIGEKKEYVYFC